MVGLDLSEKGSKGTGWSSLSAGMSVERSSGVILIALVEQPRWRIERNPPTERGRFMAAMA